MTVEISAAPPPIGSLAVNAERWAAVALERDWVSGWVEGAIFASEMVYFLAACDTERIATIIESGRQDGYSTRILGEYARITGTKVHSIDIEWDKARAEACRRSLAGLPVELHGGDAFSLVPTLLARGPRASTALLLDGPKGWSALSLAFSAAAFDNVALLSLHNLAQGYDFTDFVQSRLAPSPLFHEQRLPDTGGAWGALLSRERDFCSAAGARRSLERSSLGIMFLDQIDRRALPRFHRSFKFYQPGLVRAGWSLNLFEASAKLYNLSFRVFGG